MISIFQLKTPNEKALERINYLLAQLSAHTKPFSMQDLEAFLAQPNLVLLIAQEHTEVVGMGSMYIMRTLSAGKACIEDVVVDEESRGKGIGKLITKKLVDIAKEQHADHIDLTSKPERVAANELYKKLGFELRHTNVYRLNLK